VTVEEIGGGVESLHPVGWREAGLEHEGMHDVISGMGMTILRSMRIGHANEDAMSEEKGTGGGVIEFATIVALDGLNRCAELSSDIRKKVRKGRKCVQLIKVVKEKSMSNMSNHQEL
jgi:hypothetical protein